MTAETPDLSHEELRQVVQDAVDAAAGSYTNDASVDVEERVREELRSRGLEVEDDEWVRELAGHIRSGHPVEVGVDEQGKPTSG